MTHTRDPRVVAIAEKLAEAQPYGGAEPSGFDFRKKPPSAADYHAAVIAVNTLDEQAEYEYNIQKGGFKPLYDTWGDRKLTESLLFEVQSGIFADPDYRLIRRRKAGPVEDV